MYVMNHENSIYSSTYSFEIIIFKNVLLKIKSERTRSVQNSRLFT